jgi:hypothetical protein
MGEVERPNPGHGGRANQTRRQMKALKSTFASPDADFHQRASSDELRDTHRPVLGSVGRRPADRRWRPSERSDGTCARFPTRDRCPEGSASSSPRSKLGSSGECLRVPLRWTSEVVADHSAEQLRRPRTRPGAPRCRGREPLGARLQEGTGEARASEVGASRSRSRVASTARAAPGRPYALVSELSRRDAGSTRWVREARASRPTALELGGARRTPGVRKGSGSHAGTETERELRPGRGATPGLRMDASTWTVEDVATGHAERELRASKKRAPGPDQPSG